MKKIGERSVLSRLKSQWQVVPVFLSGIILIMLLINDLQTPPSPTSSVLYIEYLLSFIASFILFFFKCIIYSFGKTSTLIYYDMLYFIDII